MHDEDVRRTGKKVSFLHSDFFVAATASGAIDWLAVDLSLNRFFNWGDVFDSQWQTLMMFYSVLNCVAAGADQLAALLKLKSVLNDELSGRILQLFSDRVWELCKEFIWILLLLEVCPIPLIIFIILIVCVCQCSRVIDWKLRTFEVRHELLQLVQWIVQSQISLDISYAHFVDFSFIIEHVVLISNALRGLFVEIIHSPFSLDANNVVP